MAEQKQFIEVTLDYPIEKLDGDGNIITIKTVKVFRIKTKHLKAIPDYVFQNMENGETKLGIKEMILILSATSSLKDDDMDELDISDLQKIMKAMSEENLL